MRTITKYVTFDGAEHSSHKDATKHLDKLHSELLSNLVLHVINTGQGKYLLTGEYIDANLDKFLALQTIKNDYDSLTDEEE